MKRLTKFDGEEYIPACFDTCTEKDCDDCPKSDPDLWINEVGKYEDAEESGLMVRLPCKVGDTVYVIYDGDVTSAKVLAFYIDRDGGMFDLQIRTKDETAVGFKTVIDKDNYTFDDVFLTLEEAEKTMKERDAK